MVNKIKKELSDFGITFKYDDRDNLKPGYKFNEYELKGVPIRIAIGPRDLENNVAELARRDTMEKTIVPMLDINKYIKSTLEEIQKNLFDKAYNFREEHITEVDTFDKFKSVLSGKGGFVSAHWDGTIDTEQAIKETKATIRCIPFQIKIDKEIVFTQENLFSKGLVCKQLKKIFTCCCKSNFWLHNYFFKCKFAAKNIGPFVYRLGRQVFILERGFDSPTATKPL